MANSMLTWSLPSVSDIPVIQFTTLGEPPILYPTTETPMPLVTRQQKMIDSGEAVVVTVLPGKTVRGTTYFVETTLLVSPEYAKFLVEQGDAK